MSSNRDLQRQFFNELLGTLEDLARNHLKLVDRVKELVDESQETDRVLAGLNERIEALEGESK